MRLRTQLAAAAFGCLWLTSVGALDAVGRRYIDRLVKGGPETIREVGESMYNTAVRDQEVLDVAAEVLLERYAGAGDSFVYNDAMAWLCKALGMSGNGRYRPVLAEIADKGNHRRLRGHCEGALKALARAPEVAGYVAGTVDLQRLRTSPQQAASTTTSAVTDPTGANIEPARVESPPQNAPARTARRTVDIGLIREGMSMQEVDDLLGPPTSSSQRLTGKQWIPFNYGARDLQRMNYFYKGVGRVEFSLVTAYNGVYRVISVNADPHESGYP